MGKSDDIKAIAKKYSIAEINVIDKSGVIIDSTQSEFLHYNMVNGEQVAEFLVLLKGRKELVQQYQATSHESYVYRKYAGAALPEGGFVQVGYDATQFQNDINHSVVGATKNRHVGKDGYMIIADENWNIRLDGNYRPPNRSGGICQRGTQSPACNAPRRKI